MANKKIYNESHQIGYVYDDSMLLHYAPNQLENPDRIVAIYNELKKRGYLNKMIKVESKSATKDELLLAHDERYINTMFNIFSKSQSYIEICLESMDSMFGNKDSLISALVAAGSTLNLMKSILDGHIMHGVAIVRPPSHHAYKDKASGFCFFNHQAIVTRHATRLGKKVAIVNWDVHHSNGVEDILKNDKNTLAISLHRHNHGNFYPGTGKVVNSNCIYNIPINHVAYDDDYYDMFDNKVIPKLEEFNPDIIIISAGFDSGEGDPLGGFHVTPQGYHTLTSKLLKFNKPILIVLEGGYNLNTIANSMAECVKALFDCIGN